MTTYDKVRKWEEKMAEESGKITVSVSQIIELLKGFLDQIPSLRNEQKRDDSEAFIEWKSSVESVLRRTFNEKSPEYTSFRSIHYYIVVGFGDEDDAELNKEYQSGLDKASAQLKSVIRMLSEMGVPRTESVIRKSGTNISVNPVFHQDNHMRQSQTQTLNVQQIVESIENTLGEGLLEQIKPELEAYKENPGKWANAQKLAVKILDFGIAYAPLAISLLSLFLQK